MYGIYNWPRESTLLLSRHAPPHYKKRWNNKQQFAFRLQILIFPLDLSGDTIWLWTKCVLAWAQWMNMSPFISLCTYNYKYYSLRSICRRTQKIKQHGRERLTVRTASCQATLICLIHQSSTYSGDGYRLKVSELRVVKIAHLSEHLFLWNSWIVFSAGLVFFCDSYIHLFVIWTESSRNVAITGFLLTYFFIVTCLPVLNRFHLKDSLVNPRHYFVWEHSRSAKV